MSFTINTNVSARIAGLYSGRADSAIGKSVTGLSSGKKLLSPADDAGGLAVALRIDSVVRNHHELLRSNLAALGNAHGRIMDADIAVESSQLAKQKVIRESSVSMQVQANRLTYLGLTLIGAD